MIVRLLMMRNDSFHRCKDDEELLSPKVYYIIVLMTHLCTLIIVHA